MRNAANPLFSVINDETILCNLLESNTASQNSTARLAAVTAAQGCRRT